MDLQTVFLRAAENDTIGIIYHFVPSVERASADP